MLPLRYRLDEFVEFGFDAFALCVECFEDGLDGVMDGFGHAFESIELHGAHFNKLTAHGDEVADIA